MIPMLAFKADFTPGSKSSRVPTYPCYIQYKYNGIRAIWYEGQLNSRDNLIWPEHILPHIYHALQPIRNRFPNLHLDGELYCHGMSRQEINRRVAIGRKTCHADVERIQFVAFDVISRATFQDRFVSNRARLDNLFSTCQALVTAETFWCDSLRAWDQIHRLAVNERYEGTMWRAPSAAYGRVEQCTNQENRWPCLLKRKDRLDMDCIVVEVEEGIDGCHDSTGALKLRATINGTTVTFFAGSGLSIAQRQLYWQHRDKLPSRRAEISYEALSDAGIPLQPVIEYVDDADLTA